jgi:hypothetical protein
MYSIRKKAAGFVIDQDVRVKNTWLRITSKSGNTFNVWANGKEVDVFTNFDSIAPGLKIGQWLKDNKDVVYS